MRTILSRAAGACVGLVAAVGLGICTAQAAVAPSLSFLVERGGSPIGTHKITFHRDGENLDVRIDIALAVSFGPITVFRYEHRNREVWRGGRLVSIETHTNDDGTVYDVKGRATDKGFEIDSSSEGHVIAPAGIVPASYWNPDTLKQTELLDTQRGRIVHVKLSPVGESMVDVNGVPLKAREYEMSGDLRMRLWYTPDGRWVKLAFHARGADVAYAVDYADSNAYRMIASR